MRESEVKSLRGSVSKFLENLGNSKGKFTEQDNIELTILEGSLKTALRKLDYMVENMELLKGDASWSFVSGDNVPPITAADLQWPATTSNYTNINTNGGYITFQE